MPGKPIAWVTCRDCTKRTYHSKSDARLVRRRIPGRLTVYRCPVGAGWHLGHLPAMVVRGLAGRDQLAVRLNRGGVA